MRCGRRFFKRLLGFWIGAGSRDETAAKTGISHFIEHLLFKGTSTHSAQEIAEIFDGLGGELNAATSRETTVVYARVPDELALKANLLGTDAMVREVTIGQDGLAAKSVTWIEKGVVKNLYYDRYWAKKQDKPFTPTNPQQSLMLDGGDATIDQIQTLNPELRRWTTPVNSNARRRKPRAAAAASFARRVCSAASACAASISLC